MKYYLIAIEQQLAAALFLSRSRCSPVSPIPLLVHAYTCAQYYLDMQTAARLPPAVELNTTAHVTEVLSMYKSSLSPREKMNPSSLRMRMEFVMPSAQKLKRILILAHPLQAISS